MSKLSGTTNDQRLRTYKPKVRAINALEPAIAALSDEQLRARTDEFRAKIAASGDRPQPPSNGRPGAGDRRRS